MPWVERTERYVTSRHGQVNIGSRVRMRVGGGGYNECFWVTVSMKNNPRSSKVARTFNFRPPGVQYSVFVSLPVPLMTTTTPSPWH